MKASRSLMKRTFVLAAVACIALTVSACGPDVPPETTVSQKTEQFNELMNRPDIDQALAQYAELYDKVRTQVTAVVPSLTWRQADEISGSGCGNDFAAVNAGLRAFDAVERGLPNWVAKGNLPDSQWKQVASTVEQVARTYGFGGGEVVVNQPGNHEVVFRDRFNAELNFGTAVNTTLLLRTGCHLTAEAKKRGTPAAPPTY